ncbi:thioredoxin domain-containing protein [Arcanobacterium hippocoleae]
MNKEPNYVPAADKDHIPDTASSNIPQYPQAAKVNSSKILIIAVIALAMLAVIFAALFFTSRTNNDGARPENPAASQQQPNPQSGTGTGTNDNQNTDGDSANTGEQELPQEVKDLINAQHRLDPNDPMAKGDVKAPVVIEVYADFRCGHCITYSLKTEPQLAARIKAGEIRYEFNSLPVLGQESVLAAHAAQAAANQNKFWEYHDELFQLAASGNAQYNDGTFTEIAKQVGVANLDQFIADMKSAETAQKSKLQLSVRNSLESTAHPRS